MNIRIANIETSHLKELAIIFNEYRIFYTMESDVQSTFNFLESRLLNEESQIFIAKIDECIVGFVQLYPIFSSTKLKRKWLLNDLFVLHKYRRCGIASLLLLKAKEFANETKSCGFMLETTKNNFEANSLYTAFDLSLDSSHHYYSFDIEY